MTGGILLDTCAAIWITEDAPIAAGASAALEEALDAAGAVLVSPMTAWEIGLLVARGRVTLVRPPAAWFAALTAAPGTAEAPLTPEMLIASSFLPGAPPRDPVDRILAATSRALGCRLMTRDRALLAYADAGHLAAIAC